MKFVTSLTEFEPIQSVVAIGNFDGVHLGHRAVIEAAREFASARHLPLVVLTFEPHPRRFFQPDAPAFRLTTPKRRAELLEQLGVAVSVQLPFDVELATLSAEDFVRKILVQGLRARAVFVGEDFQFGHDRAGDSATLKTLLHGYDINCVSLNLVENDTARISSTAIRQALQNGRPGDAAEMLGDWYRLPGIVQHGEKRGRGLGYPTANLSLGALHVPKLGVYAVIVNVVDGPYAGRYYGVASLGVRPMFGKNDPNLETHIFDFDGDIYGEEISVALIAYLRPELKFNTLDELIAAMDHDCEQAKRALEGL